MKYPLTWSDTNQRNGIIHEVTQQFNAELQGKGGDITLEHLDSTHREELNRLAKKITQSTPFFADAFRLSLKQMEGYWRALTPTILRDPHSFAVGLYDGDSLRAVVMYGSAAFPHILNTFRFLFALLFFIGPLGLIRYLKAIVQYESILELSSEEGSSLLRMLWLYVDPAIENIGYGTIMIDFTKEIVHKMGFIGMQGVFDSLDKKLLYFYKSRGVKFRKWGIISGYKVQELIWYADGSEPLS